MLETIAYYPTQNASKYLQQLCKHLGHKIEVSFSETAGHCALIAGPAELTADAEGLTVRLTAEDANGLIQSRYVIDSHLVTFAFREGFSGLSWSQA